MQQQVASCGICDAPIFLDVRDGMPMATLERLFRRAAEDHLQAHPAPEVARFQLRQLLDRLAPEERRSAVREVYRDLRELWGDSDSRGVYRIEDALGDVSVVRLWLDARRCSGARCPHAPLDA